MRILLIVFTLFLNNISYSQKTDSLGCLCTYTSTISYSKKAQENKISGTVIVVFDRDSNCVFSNPVVIKGLGYGCDEEALRLAKQKADQSSKCALKCPGSKCSIDKVRWPITFQYVPE
jgi:periplasmic protein TonB